MNCQRINICILLSILAIVMQSNAIEFSIDWGLFISYYHVLNNDNYYTGRYNANLGITIYKPKPLYIKIDGAIYSYGSKEKESDNINYYYLNSSLGIVGYKINNIEIIPSISASYYQYDISELNHSLLKFSPIINIYTNDSMQDNICLQLSISYHDDICYGAELSYSHLFTDDAGIKITLAHDNYDDSIITTSISASVTYRK